MKTLQITMSVLITMEVVSSSAIILFLGIAVNVKMAMHWQTMAKLAMVCINRQYTVCLPVSLLSHLLLLHSSLPQVDAKVSG